MGDNGSGTFGGVIKNRGETGEGAGGAGKSEERDQHGGVHDVFAEIFLFCGETENQKHETESGRNQGGVVGGAGEDKTGQTKKDVGEGKADGEVGHRSMVEDFWNGEKNV